MRGGLDALTFNQPLPQPLRPHPMQWVSSLSFAHSVVVPFASKVVLSGPVRK